MAKISPVSIKYTITADFASEGPVEKPDVIGALFGQTEGLLGQEMELRELQKEGKIGRIEVNLETENGKTLGEVIIPSALDKTETTIIAAALETIDKIGPTDAKITIKEIDDVRSSKRDYILERAKKLLGEVANTGMDVNEIGDELRESTRIAKISEYGSEKLPAGDISGKEVIVVEGRADVVNLLRFGINNVVGMNGTKLPKTISELGDEKELILFVDGDRGGKLIAKNVCDNAKVMEIAQAPDGKEVEELTGKEILQALRRKVKPKEFLFKMERDSGTRTRTRTEFSQRRTRTSEEPTQKTTRTKSLTKDEVSKVANLESELKSRNVLILNSDLETIRNVPSSKLDFLRVSDVFVLVTNSANSKIISSAEKFGAKYVFAKSFQKIDETSIELISI